MWFSFNEFAGINKLWDLIFLIFSYRYLQEVGYTDTILDVRSQRVRSLLGLSNSEPNGSVETKNLEQILNGGESPKQKGQEIKRYELYLFVVAQSLSCVQLLQLLGLHYARLPCPSVSPGACSDSCSLCHWCHPTFSSSVAPFSCPQSFPASECFPLSWLLASGGQSIGALVSVLPLNIQGWFPLGKTVLISLLSKGLSRVFSRTTIRKHQFLSA